ncbi:MAG TPA: CinA family protein [Marinobacterium sp.]|nr:CinA family protein [Marinobacterium sp.]
MEALAKRLGEALLGRNLVLATAESCTGGWVSALVTSVAGSSAWFDAGFVTYSNLAKQRMLGVREETLETQGAVSEAVVLEMVTGACINSKANCAVSISGVAGPDGGSLEKPVGTVWVGWRVHQHVWAQRFQFRGDRTEIRRQAVEAALSGLIESKYL